MARYQADQNKVGGLHESGTYAQYGGNGSAFWIGMVQNHEVSDDEGLIEHRYLGTATRNFDSFIQGPINVTGTLEYNPQDMRILFWTIGSTYTLSGTTTHITTATEVDTDVRQSGFTSGTLNPPMSFAIDDSKQSAGTGRNFNRRIRGVVPNVTTLELNQGEKAMITVDYVAQSLEHSSGTTTTFAEITRRPYLWSDSLLTIAGSNITTAKSISFAVDQGREMAHYVNGSRVAESPTQGNRNYTVELTMDWEGTQADMLYREFYKGGSKFNMTLSLNADSTAGSQHATFFMSGCFITSTGVPSPLEGVNEATLTIRPETVNATEYNFFTSGMNINPW